jgi:hypothetical protein
MQQKKQVIQTLQALECEIRLLTDYARECCGCYAILRKKLDTLAAFIADANNQASWDQWGDDRIVAGHGRRLRDAAVTALSSLEKHLCRCAFHDDAETGSYLASLSGAVHGELRSATIDRDARVIFIGAGALPTSAMLIARETGAALLCLDIDEEAVALGAALAAREGLQGSVKFSSQPVTQAGFARDATHFVVASLVREKQAVLAQIRTIMRRDAKVLLRYGNGIKSLFNYPVTGSWVQSWKTTSLAVHQPLYDTLMLERHAYA